MSRRLPLLLTLALIQAVLAGTARSQTFYFADGRKASMPEAKIQGTNILVPLKLAGTDDGSAVITLPIASLARIDWPVPPALADANADLKAGKPADALKKIDAVLGPQEPFRNVAGSWWNQGAIIKTIALARLGKNVDADVMLDRMRRAKASPDDLSRGEIAIIEQLIATGKTDLANSRLSKIQGSATDDASLASIALIQAQILERAGKAEEALLAYLRIPVFYSGEDDQMPAALLGAARAYKKLGDTERAAATLATLTGRFPNSPEAAQAAKL